MIRPNPKLPISIPPLLTPGMGGISSVKLSEIPFAVALNSTVFVYYRIHNLLQNENKSASCFYSCFDICSVEF